jgi:hypothetical protein
MNHIPGTYYAMNYDPVSNRLYAADAKSFGADGEVSIFETNGTLVRTFAAQLGPGRIVFRY